LAGCLLAVACGLAVGDGAAADDRAPFPPDGSPAWFVPGLVQPASPAPVAAAPASSKNSRRSIGTCRTIPSRCHSYGQSRFGRRFVAARLVAARLGELGTLSDPETAPDSLYALAAAGIYLLPADDRGWTPDSYEN
jgi:hypothetical protein